jgi:hypothetical protein
MEKVNLKKEFKAFYHASAKKPSLLTVPPMNFLMIDGKGNPNTSQRYREAVEALYALAYALKFKVKKGSLQIDYGVMPLEGLWWAEDMASFDVNHKEDWLSAGKQLSRPQLASLLQYPAMLPLTGWLRYVVH